MCNPHRAMLKMKWFPLFLLPVLLAGCVSSSITNLTSTRQPRNPTGLYPIDYEWSTSQQTIRPDTITPYVVVGFDFYKMHQTLKMTNRWEVLIPVPADKNSVNYYFKVDYDYNRIGKPGKQSLRSPGYKLYVTEK